MDDLPDELRAEVLRRLPPRHLAVSRAVCRGWRGAIDGHGLLLAVAHLLPRPLRGIFISFFREPGHAFFSRPASPAIDAALRFLPDWWKPRGRAGVLDQCNGLLLYEVNDSRAGDSMYDCNPATRRWAPLPAPPIRDFFRCRTYLVFDPTVALHYSVFYFPDAPTEPDNVPPRHRGKRNRSCTDNVMTSDYEREHNRIGSMEWPPYSYAVQLFSSTTGQWEEKHFIRVGDPMLTISDVWSDPSIPTCNVTMRRYAVYWQQALYLHCRGGFIIRLSLLEDKYLVIRTPESEYGQELEDNSPYEYLGKSKLGVYYTVLRGYHFQVWVLHEASELRPQMVEWELKHQAHLEPCFQRHYTMRHGTKETNKCWILNPSEKESEDMGDCEWDSSDDSIIDVEEEGELYYECCVDRCYGIDLLGYHPSKEIAFLANRFRGFAYNMNNANQECLGTLCHIGRHASASSAPTLRSFIYTPCLYDQLPTDNDDG